jgi:hypothetical protein
MELVSLTDVERKIWCKTCQKYASVKGIGTCFIHKKCGHVITIEEHEEHEKSIDCNSAVGNG